VQRDGNLIFVEVGLLDLGGAALPGFEARKQYYRTHRAPNPKWDGRFAYGRILEFGTPRQAPEPWFRPAFNSFRRAGLKRMLKAALDRLGLPQ
jgi:hypothetical protein